MRNFFFFFFFFETESHSIHTFGGRGTPLGVVKGLGWNGWSLVGFSKSGLKFLYLEFVDLN